MAGNGNGKGKGGGVRSARRREELRRALRKPAVDLKSLFLRRDLLGVVIVFALFFLAVGMLTDIAHRRPRLVPGQVMTETRLKRVDFEVENEVQTAQARDAARERAPHVYRLNQAYVDEIRSALEELPKVVADKTLAEIAPELVEQFELSDERLAMLQSHVVEGEVSAAWRQWVARDLIEKAIVRNPALATREWQVENTRSHLPEYLVEGSLVQMRAVEVNPDDPLALRGQWLRVLQAAGIPDDVAGVITARLTWRPQPTYVQDDEATRARAEAMAQAVPPIVVPHRAGEPIYRRGDILRDEQIAIMDREVAQYRELAPGAAQWAVRLGRFGVAAFAAIFMAGYLIRFYPRVTRNPWRVSAVAGLSAGMVAVSVWIAVTAPPFLAMIAVASTLFLAMVLVTAYDQRLAATIAGIHAALTTFALGQSLGFFVLLAAGCGTAIALLRELRHRNSLIRAALMSSIVVGVGSLLLGLLETPLLDARMEPIDGAGAQILARAGLAAVGAMGVGFLLLGLLPSIERAFGMTTGMTLVELRDPRNPLLRQLQERAPGTYNHSLQVATIAEAAADAIGMDGLLTYVGALYHDIGKMNKPDYFVENASGGPNRHAKLSPAMSLLVIVGHVKDGVELAREYNLPRAIIHFIESHHGTTLVEYFYHAAKSKAEQEGERVAEVEFRYPGPKPRTKEAAILMIADACESATRAMDDPGPASIENLVRKLSRKRLKDGQFDECDLTLRELTTIEDAIIKSIWALYHGRVAYPAADAAPAADDESTATAETKIIDVIAPDARSPIRSSA
jgi:putative nucleotidyltransferase with HDIG domain